MQWLVRAIETEIIPRLMAAHKDEHPQQSREARSQPIRQEDVQAFVDIVLQHDAAVCRHFVDSVRSRGIGLPSIYLDLFTPAARQLGGLWVDDRCDFTQVTIALWRIQQLMYDLSPDFRQDQDVPVVSQRRIMLMPVPGSQHTLGILMVSEFFRRAGWIVWADPTATRERLVDAIHDEWFDIAGISVGSVAQLEGLPRFVAELRQSSNNSSLIIMAGGPLIHQHPEYADQIGADTITTDAESAVAEAERLVSMQPARNAEVGFP